MGEEAKGIDNNDDTMTIENIAEKEGCCYPISAKSIDPKLVGDIPEHDRMDCEEGGCKRRRLKSTLGFS